MLTVLSENKKWKIAVVIPCYKVTKHIAKVIRAIGPEIESIYVVDDFCPENSGKYVSENSIDSRVKLIFHNKNEGVGGAVITGYREAFKHGADIVVKIDGDGQMDASLIPFFIAPIMRGDADYTKGNRFFDLSQINNMPTIRIFGNALLSFASKFSTGYWNIFDPTNGYTAIHSSVAKYLPLDKISKRYFFESDILFRLNCLRAVVMDIPISASYGDESSNLKVQKIFAEFLYKHIRNFIKRIFYNYYLRDLSIGSFQLPVGILMLIYGTVIGVSTWRHAIDTNLQTPTGTIMLSVLPIIIGINLLLAFVNYDISTTPTHVMHRQLFNNKY
jgi:glycosyltransferase involved in cell wall biosynthesis